MSLGDYEFLNDEGVDFSVKPSPDGVWCWLICSVHGDVTAATWPSRDLLSLMVEAKSHYERLHGQTPV